MKKIIYFIAFIAFITSCTEEMQNINLGDPLTSEQVVLNVTQTATANVYDISVTVPQGIVKIDLGNGSKIEGNSGQAQYPFKGDYTITVNVAAPGGITTKVMTLKVAIDNYELLNDPVYNLLTGGVNAAQGKTWVLDSLAKGHMGVGPDNAFTPDWWSASPLDKKGKMIYDDEITFMLKGAKVMLKNNGKSYVNGGGEAAMKARGATLEPEANYGSAGGDFVASYNPGTNWTWGITKDGTNNYISFPLKEAFFMYFVGESDKYQILSLTENEMHIRVQLPGLAWYFKLIKKGFVKDIPVPTTKPYGTTNVNVSFDAASVPAFTWIDKDVSEIATIDNPYKAGINTSNKIAKYHRGTAQRFANVSFPVPVNMNLTQRNKFKLKVYFPSTNIYYANYKGELYNWGEGETSTFNSYYQAHHNPTVEIRLQNGERDDPWNEQKGIAKVVTQFDTWVEYEFDFSSEAAIKTYDRILIQMGGEPKTIDGIFYFDDLVLLP